MTTVNVYLTFNGNCEAAFNFYKSVFGGDFTYIGRFKDMPPMGDKEMSAADGDKIMHVALPVSNETNLMGSDTVEGFGAPLKVGNNFSISVNTDSKAEADRLFNDLSSGGTVGMPMNETFWGAYFGMCTDKFGINWMVSFEKEQQK